MALCGNNYFILKWIKELTFYHAWEIINNNFTPRFLWPAIQYPIAPLLYWYNTQVAVLYLDLAMQLLQQSSSIATPFHSYPRI